MDAAESGGGEYLVNGESFDAFVVGVATQQQLDQVVDGRPLRYQQALVFRLQFQFNNKS